MIAKHSVLSALGMTFVAATCVQAAVHWTPTETSWTTNGIFSSSNDFPTSAALSNLTTLGPTDWVAWGWDSNAIVEVRSKNGGSGIGSVSANRTTGQITATTTSRLPDSVFDFTDGTAPNVSGTDFDAAAGLYRGDSPSPLPVFSFTVPLNADGSENTVVFWFSATKLNANGLKLRAFDGLTQLGSDVTPSIATGDNANKYIYTIDYGGADTARGLRIEVAMTSSTQNDGILALHGAALEVVPEPSSLAVLSLAALPMLRRRRPV